MAIVKLEKVSIVGQVTRKQSVLKALQQFGELHIIDLKGASKDTALSDKLSDELKKALRYLESSPVKRKQAPYTEELNIEEIIIKTRCNEQRKREYSDKYDALLQREATLSPWGDFELPRLEDIAGNSLWFYILPRKYLKCLLDLTYPWEIVHQNHSHAWVVLIGQIEPPADILPVERFHTGKYSLSAITEQRIRAELDLEDIEVERQQLTRYIHVMKRKRARAIDQTNLGIAIASSVDLEKLFIVQAWVAKNSLAKLGALAERYEIAVYAEPVSEEDDPPTLLSNPDKVKGGEALVNFYQTPAYTAWDPSFILFVSFSLFFAMILSDAAYSAILLSGLLASWFKLGKTETGKNLRPLLGSICLTSLVWGMLVGSYFGKAPGEESLFGVIHILDVNDFDTMMMLSIACGLLHIMLANLQQVFLYWGSAKSLLHTGWVLVLVAGAIVGLTFENHPELVNYGYAFGVCGLVLVFVAGGQRKIHTGIDVVIRILEGFKSLTAITNIFGDVLSYLRLFALGLASASLALTFNDLASHAFASESGLGVLFGLLILIVGHTLNLFLAIVSGVVHGLRLNFIEFYKWALDGEGHPFKAFKKREYSQ